MRLREWPLIRFVTALALLLTTSSWTFGQNYTWSVTTGGTWVDGANWGNTPGNYPRNANDTAYFSSTGNSSAKTVTLDAAISIRALEFNANQTGSVTIASGTGGSLTLTNTVGQPTSITVDTASGDHTFAANLAIAGPVAQTWSIGANRTFTVTGSVSGTQGVTVAGGGTVLLNGTNSYSGPTTVSAGTLGGRGSLASAVTVSTGATITAGTSSSTPALTLNNGLTLSGRYLATLFSTTTSSQLIIPTGTASIGAGSLELALGSGVTVSSMRAAGPQTFTILDAGNGQLAGTFASTNFTTAGFAATEWTVNYDTVNGNITLNFTPVPEPITVLGIAAAGLVLAWRFRRRPTIRAMSTIN